MTYTKVSGAVGISLLKNIDKRVFLYYDNHFNTKYCEKEYKFIDELFMDIINKFEKYNDLLFLVEEPYIRTDDIKFIWQDTKHLTKFLNFFKTNEYKDYIYPTDIRNCISYFDISVIDKQPYDITLYDYIYPLLYFYDLPEITKNNLFINNKKLVNNFIKIKNKFNNLLKSTDNRIMGIINKVKYRINKYIIKHENKINLTIKELKKIGLQYNNNIIIGYPYTYDVNLSWSQEYNLLIDITMELFTLVHLLSNNKKYNVLYYGLAHLVNIEYLLENIFGYHLVKANGLTKSKLINNNSYIINIDNIDNEKNCSSIL